ncbi:MAG: tripartite tricarboxylate transporter substrate binding protein [Betaproteobacteria bacterium]
MRFFRTLCITLSLGLSALASAQTYPSKPVKLIVPYAAGGTGDILARLIAQELSKQSGQSFVVENRTGAGGLIGYGAGAKAVGDGYTLVAMDSSYTMFPGLYGERVDWNIETDLVPVSMYGRAAFALAVNPAKNYKGADDLVRTARDKPGAVSFGTPGMGTLHHVFTSLLTATTGVQMTHVPYRGASEALNAVLGNNVDWTFVAMPTITGQLGNERLRVIAITSENRSPLLPNVPTLREAGIAMTVANWFGLGTPKGTPPEVVAYLHKQVTDALKSPEVAARMKAMGAEVVGNSPAEFAQILRSDLRLWTKVIKDAGIKN